MIRPPQRPNRLPMTASRDQQHEASPITTDGTVTLAPEPTWASRSRSRPCRRSSHQSDPANAVISPFSTASGLPGREVLEPGRELEDVPERRQEEDRERDHRRADQPEGRQSLPDPGRPARRTGTLTSSRCPRLDVRCHQCLLRSESRVRNRSGGRPRRPPPEPSWIQLRSADGRLDLLPGLDVRGAVRQRRLEPGLRRRERGGVVRARRRRRSPCSGRAPQRRSAARRRTGRRRSARRPTFGSLAAATADVARPGTLVLAPSTSPQTQARRPSFGCMYSIGTPFIFGWFLIFQYPSGHVYVMSMLPLTKSLTVSVCERPEVAEVRRDLLHGLRGRLDLLRGQLVRIDRLAGVDEVADLDDRDLVGEQRHAALVLGVEQDVPRQLGRVAPCRRGR